MPSANSHPKPAPRACHSAFALVLACAFVLLASHTAAYAAEAGAQAGSGAEEASGAPAPSLSEPAASQPTATCAASWAPAEITGASNTAREPTGVSIRWKIRQPVQKYLVEQRALVWPASETRSQARSVTDRHTSRRSFTFDNAGEDDESSVAGGEQAFIEPNTAYRLAVVAVYGKSGEYPRGCTVEGKGKASVTTRPIVGTNGAYCCSARREAKFVRNSEALVSGGIASDRIEATDDAETESESTHGNSLELASEFGFLNNDVIVGNTNDWQRLSTVSTASWVKQALGQVERAAAYGNTLMEVGNEMWLKGECGECAEPVKYAEMFVALSKEAQRAKQAGALPADVKLLFDLTGDYDGSSRIGERRGWLGDALKAQPELKSRIEGFTFHPYDLEGRTLAEEETVPSYQYDYGLRGLKADYQEAIELGVEHTNVFATEFGICRNKPYEGRTCETRGAPKSEAEDEQQAETVYDELLDGSLFPEVKGLWWFPSYPAEDKYAFFAGWGGGEETQLLRFLSRVSSQA
ncbi:MAG TPA: hypothetical protein VGY13_13185 [Solirubrobacteraceae bacterium]|nr:hypothetical protein [Solirubrobacteraceae bacterium]